MAVEGRTELGEACLEIGKHPQAEKAVRGDLLIAAQSLREPSTVAAMEQKDRQRGMGALPEEVTTAGRLQSFERPWISRKHVQPRLDIVYTVHEEREVNAR